MSQNVRLASQLLASRKLRGEPFNQGIVPAVPRDGATIFLIGGAHMKPINIGGHAAYQTRLISQLKKYYPDALVRLPPAVWDTIEAFYTLDLSSIDLVMADRYSVFGPVPRLPSDMVRSMLIALKFKKHNYTDWSAELKINPLAAILSGFVVGDTPGIGTFYDFSDRLWLSNRDNIFPHAQPPKVKVVKPKNPDEKADPVEKITVEEFLRQLEESPPTDDQPYARLFQIFNNLFLQHSADLGLIDLNNLVLSGDGTPVETMHRNRYRRLCKCREKGIMDCKCNRYYSQPDTNCGYDSSRHKNYYGYDLYMMTAADSYSDLPVFPLLGQGSTHDSFGFCSTYFAMTAFLKEINVSEVLLDSAHDAMAIYQFLQKNSVRAIIDLNERKGVSFEYKDNFTVGKDGIPVCKAGLKMIRDGTEKDRMRIKYRCPNCYHPDGIHCDHKCSDSDYGRVVHVATKDNPRLFTIPPRESVEWKEEYKKRTSSERCNKREKEDYHLESGKHRSTKMWYCRLYCIMMCQHLDAWGSAPSTSSLRDILAQAA